MEKSICRILLVDDYEPWRALVTSMLQKQADLQIIGEAANGLEAVQIAQQLQPDLVLLDVGLPQLNGLEAAPQIREVCPRSKIIFVTENRSRDIAEAALRTSADGYVVKAAASSELLAAVETVLNGKRFVSVSLTGPALPDYEPATVETAGRHEVGFYSDDQRLLDDMTQFISAALLAGNAGIVIATESHRNSLLPRLQARGIDIATAIERGRYIALDAADCLATCMVGDVLDRVRFMEAFGNFIVAAQKAANGEHPRVAVFGEGVQLLWVQGNADAALQDERLCNELTKIYDVDILCGYSVGTSQESMDENTFQQICAEHSAVYSR